MKTLITICLIISTVSLIGCGAVVQPINDTVSPIQAPAQAVNNTISPIKTPHKVVKEVTATPNKAVVVTGESTVVHKTIQGASAMVVAGLPPTPISTPRWINDNLVVIERHWPKTIELKIGQQIAIMPEIRHPNGWGVKYNTNILESVEDIANSELPEADWLLTAKKTGKTTIIIQSIIPPTPESCEPYLCFLGFPVITEEIVVKIVP